jgi:hypothetical protein
MRKTKESFSYEVHYEGKPGHPEILEGMHGKFLHLGDAIKAAVKCANFFNDEKKVVTRLNEAGKKETVLIEKRHDKVEVWIDELKDGYYHRTLDEKGQPCEEKSSTENSSGQKESGKKSRSTSSEKVPA